MMDYKKSCTLIFIICFVILTYLLLIEMTPADEGFIYKDKVQHVIAFAGVTFWGLLAFQAHRMAVVLGLSLFGALMEVVQGIMTTTRQPSVHDWFADLVGIALAWGMVWWLLNWWQTRRG